MDLTITRKVFDYIDYYSRKSESGTVSDYAVLDNPDLNQYGRSLIKSIIEVLLMEGELYRPQRGLLKTTRSEKGSKTQKVSGYKRWG